MGDGWLSLATIRHPRRNHPNSGCARHAEEGIGAYLLRIPGVKTYSIPLETPESTGRPCGNDDSAISQGMHSHKVTFNVRENPGQHVCEETAVTHDENVPVVMTAL